MLQAATASHRRPPPRSLLAVYEGLAALGLPTPDFYESTLQTGMNGTPIRKIHFDQLRERQLHAV